MPQVHKKLSDGRFFYRPNGVDTDITAEQTTTSTGTQNDFSLTASQTILRCNNATDLTITGFTIAGAAPVAGDRVTIISIGAGNVFFSHQTGSTAANRLINSVTSGPTPIAAGLGAATYIYDGTTSRWRLVEHYQGGAISVTFSAGDYTGSGTITWTVASGDVLTHSYQLFGKSMLWTVYVDTSSVSGTGQQLRVTRPGGYTAAKRNQTIVRIGDNGTFQAGHWVQIEGEAFCRIHPDTAGAANWTASVDNTYVRFSEFVELT